MEIEQLISEELTRTYEIQSLPVFKPVGQPPPRSSYQLNNSKFDNNNNNTNNNKPDLNKSDLQGRKVGNKPGGFITVNCSDKCVGLFDKWIVPFGIQDDPHFSIILAFD